MPTDELVHVLSAVLLQTKIVIELLSRCFARTLLDMEQKYSGKTSSRLRTSISASLDAGVGDALVKDMKEIEELGLDAVINGFDWNTCPGDMGFCISPAISRDDAADTSFGRMAASGISPRTDGQPCFSYTFFRLTSITFKRTGWKSVRVADR